MRQITRSSLLYFLLAVVGLPMNPGLAAAESESTITVYGTGKVSATPDMARVMIGVVTQRVTAGESVSQNSAAVDKILQALRGHGIAETDVQTTNFSIGPEYTYDQSAQTQRLIGYRVNNSVVVTVRSIDDLGSILDDAVGAGSNQINSVVFDIDDSQPLEDTARRAAMEDAARKAALYADEAGVRLGAVLRVDETNPPIAMPQMAFGMMQEARAVPIAPGQLSIKQTVRVTYAIDTSP